MKRALPVIAAIFLVGAAIIAIVAIMNARDPYGGPIEPAAEH